MPKSVHKPKVILPPTQPQPAKISWEGDTHEVIKEWPAEIKVDFGHSLRLMQSGEAPTLDVRPMKSIGSGVFELKTSDDKKWYRLVYLARIENVIYVLNCFEKDTAKTEKKDLNKASARLAQVRKKLMEERKHEKRDQRTPQGSSRN